MKNEELLQDAIGMIGDDLIADADYIDDADRRPRRPRIIRWSAVACACLAVIIAVSVGWLWRGDEPGVEPDVDDPKIDLEVPPTEVDPPVVDPPVVDPPVVDPPVVDPPVVDPPVVDPPVVDPPVVDPDEPVVPQYVITSSGKYVYGAVTGMSSNTGNNPFAFKPVDELSLLHIASTKIVKESDMEGEHVFNVFGKNVLLRYQESMLSPDNTDPMVKKYCDRYMFNGENDVYYFSSITNQLLQYQYFYKLPSGDLSKDDMMAIAVDIASTQLNRSVDAYVVSEEARTDPTYRTFKFVKQVHGFNTSDTIRIQISTSGAIKGFFVGQTSEFDEFEDIFTRDDIINAVEELKIALYDSGYYMEAGTSRSTLVTDGYGHLYVMVEYASGYVFYVEVDRMTDK